MTPLESLDISPREAMSESPAVRRAAERVWGIVTPLSEQEAKVLTEGGLDPQARPDVDYNPQNVPAATGPNLWSEAKVRKYLGFPSESEDIAFEFDDFADQVLVWEGFEREYYAEQFAAGSVIPGVLALWQQWPTDHWQEFADWLVGSAPGMGSSRRDFLMAGGDFVRVWREVSALSRACDE